MPTVRKPMLTALLFNVGYFHTCVYNSSLHKWKNTIAQTQKVLETFKSATLLKTEM